MSERTFELRPKWSQGAGSTDFLGQKVTGTDKNKVPEVARSLASARDETESQCGSSVAGGDGVSVGLW